MATMDLMWAFAKPILFRMDPERAHLLTMGFLKRMPQTTQGSNIKRLYGIDFRNRVGLAAGMDKNAECLNAWQSLGFGFVEVGTVTAHPQIGKPKPRLFRLLQHKALYNRMGFNNDGALAISLRIAKQRKNKNIRIPIGINIGKSAQVTLEDAASDYLASFDLLADLADYVTINVSSPNTKDLRKLQSADALSLILEKLATRNQKRQTPRPLLVKIAPDLEVSEAIGICRKAVAAGADGLIVSNTTVQSHGIATIPSGGGGLSGAPLFESSTQLLASIREAIGPKPLLIGSGGVMTPENAVAKLNQGADLVQIYSGLVYGGPGFIKACVNACDGVENLMGDGALKGLLEESRVPMSVYDKNLV